MIIQKSNIGNINRVDKSTQTPINTNTNVNKPSFQELLNNEISKSEGVKFSKHAEMRLLSRNISLTKEQTERLESAVDKAKSKGVKDTLVMLDNVALVVNVPNRTVVTAVNDKELKENVFTNIDGAVIA